jgi:CheY-like chemotaxis protein
LSRLRSVFKAFPTRRYALGGTTNVSFWLQDLDIRQASLAMVLSRPTLLITDDDRDFRETLRSVFEPRGFETFLASDGEEALDIVQQREVHLLLLDMHMPRLSGLETIRRVKQFRNILPCILMSAGLDETLAEEARRANAFSVLRKPVRFQVITGVVRDAMRNVYGWSLVDR